MCNIKPPYVVDDARSSASLRRTRSRAACSRAEADSLNLTGRRSAVADKLGESEKRKQCDEALQYMIKNSEIVLISL